MIKKDVSYLSSNKVNKIKATCFLPDNEILGVIQIVHGMSEHTKRYEHFIKYMCNLGFVVCIHDHLGHGESSDENRGHISDKNGYIYLVKDLRKLYLKIKKMYPSVPYFILGHSMGSFILRLSMAKYDYDVNGIILSGTTGKVYFIKTGIFIANIISKIKSPSHSGKIFYNLSFARYKSLFNKEDGNWVTRDMQKIEEFANDPLSNYMYSVSGYKDVFTLIKYVNQKKWYKSINNQTPIYIFSGTKDPVGLYGKGIHVLHKNLVFANISNVTVNLYENGRHEMLNDINKLDVYKDLLDWIKIQSK